MSIKKIFWNATLLSIPENKFVTWVKFIWISQIYPSTSGQTYTAVIEDLYRFSLKNFLPPSVSDVRRFDLAGEYSPVRFHDLMTALEEIHHSRAKNDTFQLTEQHLHLSSKMSKANVTTKSTVSGHSTHTSEEQLLESFPQIPCSNGEFHTWYMTNFLMP